MLAANLLVLLSVLSAGHTTDFVSCLLDVKPGSSNCALWDDVTSCLEDGGNTREAGDVWLENWEWIMENCQVDPETVGEKCSSYMERLELYLKSELDGNVSNRRIYVGVHGWLKENCNGFVTEGELRELYDHYMFNSGSFE